MLGMERPRPSKGSISRKPEEARADLPGSGKEEVSEGGGQCQEGGGGRRRRTRGRGRRRRWGRRRPGSGKEEVGKGGVGVRKEEVGEGEGRGFREGGGGGEGGSRGQGRKSWAKEEEVNERHPAPLYSAAARRPTPLGRDHLIRVWRDLPPPRGEEAHWIRPDPVKGEVRAGLRKRRREEERVTEAGSGEEEQVGDGGGEVGEGGADEEVGEIHHHLPAHWIQLDPIGGEVGEEEQGGRERGAEVGSGKEEEVGEGGGGRGQRDLEEGSRRRVPGNIETRKRGAQDVI